MDFSAAPAFSFRWTSILRVGTGERETSCKHVFTTVCHHHLYSHRTSGQRVGDALSSKASLDKPSPWMRPMLSPRIFPSLCSCRGHLFILAKLHMLNFPFQGYRSVISHPGVWVQTKGFLPLKEQGSLEHKPRGLALKSHKSGAPDSTHAV